jgi:hypothetical protein
MHAWASAAARQGAFASEEQLFLSAESNLRDIHIFQ